MSRKSNILKRTAFSNEHDMLNTNDTLKSRGTENNQSASELRQSETDFWWLSLPYVLVSALNTSVLFGIRTLVPFILPYCDWNFLMLSL